MSTNLPHPLIRDITFEAKPIELEQAKMQYFREKEGYGTETLGMPHGTHWIFGLDQQYTKWSFHYAPYVQKSLSDSDNRGYHYHLSSSSFYRLCKSCFTHDKGELIEGSLIDKFYKLFLPNDTLRKDYSKIREIYLYKELHDIFNKVLANDDNIITFQDFLLGEIETQEGLPVFIECPRRHFNVADNDNTHTNPYDNYYENAFNFDEQIAFGLEQQDKFGNACGIKLPKDAFAQSYLASYRDKKAFVDKIPTIDYLHAKATAVRTHIKKMIEQTNDQPGKQHKYLLTQWMYHPLFDDEKNYFVKFPLFHEHALVGWSILFFDGNTVNDPDHLVEAGKRLDRETRGFIGQRVHRYGNDKFPEPPEAPCNEINEDDFLNQCYRYILYHLFRIAMALGCPYFKGPINENVNNVEYVFRPVPEGQECGLPKKSFDITLGEKKTTFTFQTSSNIPYLFDEARRYCGKIANKVKSTHYRIHWEEGENDPDIKNDKTSRNIQVLVRKKMIELILNPENREIISNQEIFVKLNESMKELGMKLLSSYSSMSQTYKDTIEKCRERQYKHNRLQYFCNLERIVFLEHMISKFPGYKSVFETEMNELTEQSAKIRKLLKGTAEEKKSRKPLNNTPEAIKSRKQSITTTEAEVEAAYEVTDDEIAIMRKEFQNELITKLDKLAIKQIDRKAVKPFPSEISNQYNEE